jgi:uncharacterized protein
MRGVVAAEALESAMTKLQWGARQNSWSAAISPAECAALLDRVAATTPDGDGGEWLQTFTGRKVFPLDLQPEDIAIEDVAHHLARIGRFSGATKGEHAYSVAQHSMLVSLYCDPADALAGLLHDASEAYLLDLPRPLKRDPRFSFYREAERRAMATICAAFGLPEETPDGVKEADNRMLATEARDLMAPLHPEWRGMAAPYARRITPWSAANAEEAFLTRFRIVTGSPGRAAEDLTAYRIEGGA